MSWFNEDAITSVDRLDIRSTNWKEETREKAILWVTEDDETAKQVETELKNKEKQKNKLKSSCLSVADHLSSFCKTGDAGLLSASNLVTRRFVRLRFKNVLQERVTYYFNKTFKPDFVEYKSVTIIIRVSYIYLTTLLNGKVVLIASPTSSDHIYNVPKVVTAKTTATKLDLQKWSLLEIPLCRCLQ